MTNKEKAKIREMIEDAIHAKAEAIAHWIVYTGNNNGKKNEQLNNLIRQNWHEATGRIDVLCALLDISSTYANAKVNEKTNTICEQIENGIMSRCYKEYYVEA